MITPFATAWADVERLLRVKTLVRTVKIRTPKSVPIDRAAATAESSVPPMTTAAMASSS